MNHFRNQLTSGIKAAAGATLVRTGLHRFMMRRTGVVVAFHRVNDDMRDDLTTTSSDFRAFCLFFRKYFDVVTLSNYVERLESGRSVEGALAITFDDGYLDNYEIAAPVLRSCALPATFFVATKFIGSTIIPWWDEALPRQPGWMSWANVQSLAREGFDIGGHTQTHADMGTVSGQDAVNEVEGCRKELHERLGQYPAHFAFPYGREMNLSEANRAVVQNAGFRSCASCHGGVAPDGTDPFRLPRVPISYWFRTPEQFALEVSTRRA